MTGKIKLVHSGGNSVSVAVPTNAPSASEVEFKLPQADGSANQVLKTDGNGNLSFGADQGGKVLQTIMVEKTNTTSHSNGSTRTDISGITVNITPSATSSKILIMSTLNFCGRQGEYAFALYLMRGSTDLAIGDASSSRTRATIGGLTDTDNGYDMRPWHYTYLDSPNTTSQVTYKWQWEDTYHNQTMYLNRSYTDTDVSYAVRGASNIIVQEIAA